MMGKRRIHSRYIGMLMTGLLGVVLFAATAVFVLLLPSSLFEAFVSRTGLPAFLPAAAPPLGDTARLAVAYGLGGVAGVTGALLFRLLDRKFPARSASPARAFHFSDDVEQSGISDPVDGDYDALLARNLQPRSATASCDERDYGEDRDRGEGLDRGDEDGDEDDAGMAGELPAAAVVDIPVLPGFRRRADDSPRDGREVAYRKDALPIEEPMFIDLDLLRRGESAATRPEAPVDELDLGAWPDPASLIDAEIEFAEFEPVEFSVETAETTLHSEHDEDASSRDPERGMGGNANMGGDTKAPLFVMEPASTAPGARNVAGDPEGPDEAASISALMQRLEAGLAARSRRPAASDAVPRDAAPVSAALDELRRMARGR